MADDKILITGMGIISALGSGCEETLESLSEEWVNTVTPTLFDSTIKKPVFEIDEIPRKWLKKNMRTLSLAYTVVEEAINDAELDEDVSDLRIGVCMGTTVASQLNDLEFYTEYKKDGSLNKDAIKKYLNGNLAEAVAKQFSFTGPTLTVVNACSSGTDAIGVAMSWLKADLCDVVIAGGADELNRVPYLGFNSLSIYSEKPPKPFDSGRSGLNLGEGAGVVVLEKSSARNHNSNLFCAGYGTYTDAYHLTAPRPDGSSLENAINYAIKEAGINKDEVAFVNAHGTATINNDLVEGNTLARVFGDDIKFYSTKGYTGHTLGAAGGIEAVFCALGLDTGSIPKSAGFEKKPDDIAIAPVSKTTDIAGNYALSTSLAFGGNNSALIIGRL